MGISHTFSAPRTPQQNGVAERKNRTLIEIARTLLNDYNLPKSFWGEAVSTTCYITNRALIRGGLKKTHEILKGRKPNIGYFKPFGCKCFILNTKDHLGKFDAKSDEEIFLGYSLSSKAYRVYNKRTFKVEESMNVVFDESVCLDDDLQKNDEDDELQLGETPNDQNPSELGSSTSQVEESTQNERNSPESMEGSPVSMEGLGDFPSAEDMPQAPQHILKRHPPSQATLSKVDYNEQ